MSDERKYSLRDMVLAQREAHFRARKGQCIACTKSDCDLCKAEAAHLYPLPRVTRPHVVTCGNYSYKVEGETLYWQGMGTGWRDFTWQHVPQPTPSRIKLWADLIANPTITVEEDA